LDENNEIDDQVQLAHMNYSKTFSTIMTTSLMFLNENQNKSLWLDGSNNARAYLYFRIIQNNYDVLAEKFDIYGVKLYVRMLRSREDGGGPTDHEDIKAKFIRIIKGERIDPKKMYNAFAFRIREDDLIN
jgi:hypothetical protein